MSKDLKPHTKSSGMTPTTEDKKNITLISQLLKEIKKDKEEYNKIMKQVQDQQMEPKDILKILTLSAQKINGEYVSLEKSMYSLNEINYRDDNNGAENVRYERFELTKDRLQSVYNFQDARCKLIQKCYDNDIMETDEDEKDKKINENKTHKESQYFERIRDKLNKGSLNFKDNEYLNQLAFVQKKGYVNREREINPGAHVPAPANPNGNIISTFKYANTNDTLPKCNSIEQFNKEIDEKAQYMLNNPNGNNRKRTYIEAFEVYEDQYSEPAEDYAAKYNKYNDYVVNKRRKVISDDEDDEDEEMKEIPQNDKVDLSKFIKKSDMVIPEIPKKEPTPIWTKPSDLKSPSKEGNAYKVYKDNPIEKIAGGFNNQYNTFQNKEIAAPPVRNYRESHTPNTKGYYQQEPEYNDQRSNYSKNYKEKRAGSVKLSECDDDFFYKNKQQNPDSKNPRTGDKYIDDANSGKGFVSAEKQFNFEMCKKNGNSYDPRKIYQSAPQCGYSNDREFMQDNDDTATSKLYSNSGRQPGLGKGRKFNPPVKSDGQPGSYNPGKSVVNAMGGGMQQKGSGEHQVNYLKVDEFGNPHEGYAALDPRLVEIIEGEILEKGAEVTFNDIAGLDFAKKTINEIIILPMLRPDLFKGIRAPPKGVLLFGPPGTGKTMIGKAIASQCKFTFFNISASCLTSKWVGEGEKLVRTLFKLAVIHQPSVIFIDEIDSLLCNRTENENEAGRKIKTEFMVHMGGAGTNDEDRMLIIGATNRPFDLDEAVRRRLEKRLYIPLPTKEGRLQFVKTILDKEKHSNFQISEEDITKIVELTKGYSGADLRCLCGEAALYPLRENIDILTVSKDSIRAVLLTDFIEAINQVKPSVNQAHLYKFLEWNKDFGSYQLNEDEINT